MSVKVMSLVWEKSAQKGSALLLLLAIADHAHDHGGGAFPSIETLSAKIRMGERNTHYLLAKLEESGELRIEKSAGPSGTNVYTICLDGVQSSVKGGATHCTPAKFAGCNPLHRGGAIQRKKGVQPTAPKPSIEPLINHQQQSGIENLAENTDTRDGYLPPLGAELEEYRDDPWMTGPARKPSASHSRNESRAQSAITEGSKVCGAAATVVPAGKPGSKEDDINLFVAEFPWMHPVLAEKAKEAHTSPVAFLYTIVMGYRQNPQTIPAAPVVKPAPVVLTAAQKAEQKRLIDEKADREYWAEQESLYGKTKEQATSEQPPVEEIARNLSSLFVGAGQSSPLRNLVSRISN